MTQVTSVRNLSGRFGDRNGFRGKHLPEYSNALRSAGVWLMSRTGVMRITFSPTAQHRLSYGNGHQSTRWVGLRWLEIVSCGSN
jgi:hypothetical protein